MQINRDGYSTVQCSTASTENNIACIDDHRQMTESEKDIAAYISGFMFLHSIFGRQYNILQKCVMKIWK